MNLDPYVIRGKDGQPLRRTPPPHINTTLRRLVALYTEQARRTVRALSERQPRRVKEAPQSLAPFDGIRCASESLGGDKTVIYGPDEPEHRCESASQIRHLRNSGGAKPRRKAM